MGAPDLLSRISALVKECEAYRDELSTDRVRAIEYYDGKMVDTPSDDKRSKVVSRDVRATIKKVLPAVLRIVIGNDKVVEYQPVSQGDEEAAAQATDYINYVIFPESGGMAAVHDAVHDALRLRNGVLKWWFEEKAEVQISKHSGLQDDAFAQIVADPDVEVLEHSERQEAIEPPEGADGQTAIITVHDIRIRRKITSRAPRCAAVPLEEFLIHPDAVDIESSPIVGQKMRKRRSDLVALGYDKDVVARLSLGEADEDEESARRGDAYRQNGQDETDPALQEVDYYELFVRTDADGDGIAELHRMCFGGSITERGLLMDEECDEIQFCSVRCERKPHQWEGVSVSDDTMEIQRIKTVLMRQTLDNIYWQNNPQPVVNMDAVENMDAVFNPTFGLPIRVKAGFSARDAIAFNPVPFVAKDSFSMLDYLDKEMVDRTGISDASSGMAQDALQNVTAKASAMIEASGIGQTEQIVRTIASDLKVMFRGLLRLVIRHQDAPRMVRLRDEWVSFDPRDWDASMDATVNTGLGAGTRERDMVMMQQIMGLQEKLLAGFGPDNPFVKPANVYNAAAKMIEAAGLKSPDLYITEPDEEEVARKLEAIRNAPNPEQVKIEGQMQIEQAKSQSQIQMRQVELQAEAAASEKQMQIQRDKEAAQAEADVLVAEQKAEIEARTRADEIALQREEMERRDALEWAKLEQARNLEMLKLGLIDSEDGGTKSREDERNDIFIKALSGVERMIEQANANASSSKRVLRDENGEIIGVESFHPGAMQ